MKAYIIDKEGERIATITKPVATIKQAFNIARKSSWSFPEGAMIRLEESYDDLLIKHLEKKKETA